MLPAPIKVLAGEQDGKVWRLNFSRYPTGANRSPVRHSDHATPGASVAADGAEAYYVQAGATCDLGGLRLHHLGEQLVAEVLEQHPRTGLTADITARIAAEAAAVPQGRFALLRRTGFALAIRAAPLPG